MVHGQKSTQSQNVYFTRTMERVRETKDRPKLNRSLWRRKEICSILIVLLTLLYSVRENSALVTIADNGYRGIVVAISDNVKENLTIVKHIKDMFDLGSQTLYTATRQRAYFADVTIVIPEHWNTQPDYQSVPKGNYFSTAEVRIDEPNPAYSNNPYTLQPGGCGDPGLYIHFTPEFLGDLHGITTEEFGPPGRTLVHEWAHLRYGVFDEYGSSYDPRSPNFYIGEDLQIHVTGCTEDIVGWLRTSEGELCSLSAEGLPDSDCHFYPDAQAGGNNSHVHGSIMNMHYLEKVDTFCDDSHQVPHNYMAPNRHNILCQGRSAWSVISSHPDFDNMNNEPRENLDTTPTFRVTQVGRGPIGRYVLLLDLSRSMGAGGRIRRLRNSAARFIMDQVPIGSQVSVLTYSNDSSIVVPPTIITDDIRQSIVEKLPKKMHKYGNTAIGKGLQRAIQTLKRTTSGSEGAVVILITDGKENVKPFIEEVLGEVKESKVKVNTIAIGNNASRNLEQLTEISGGKSYYLPDDPHHQYTSPQLDAAFFDSVTYQADIKAQPLQIVNRYHNLETRESKEGFIVLDSEVGRNTKFIFTSMLSPNKQFNLEVVLLSPSNTEVGSWSDDVYRKDIYGRSIVFTIPNAETGNWKYILNNNDDFAETVSISVTTEAAHVKAEPIRIHSWISNLHLTYPDYAKVFAEVKKGYKPVLMATVLASVDRPNSRNVDLELKDDGRGADVIANDGIYSAFFTEFSGNGRYGVVAHVKNNKNTILIEDIKRRKDQKNEEVLLNLPAAVSAKKKMTLPVAVKTLPSATAEFHPSELEAYDPDKSEPPLQIIEHSVGNFERTRPSGAFQVNDFQPNLDLMPPERVTDLEVIGFSLEDTTVTLQWTSPGDDQDIGNATSLQLRFHHSSRIFRKFTIGDLVNQSHVLEGSLSPLPAGQKHQIRIKIPNKTTEDLQGRVLFFALKAKDEAGNEADMSNIGTAYFPVGVPKASRQIERYSGMIVLAILVTVVSIIGIIVIVVKCLHWRRRKQRETEGYSRSPTRLQQGPYTKANIYRKQQHLQNSISESSGAAGFSYINP